MNMVWKCVISGLFLTLFINGTGLASDIRERSGRVESDYQELTKADELFEKETYQTALETYESIFRRTFDSDIRWKAFFRMCESLTRLYRVGEAADKVISTPIPRQMPHQVHFLILKTEMLRKFLSRYSSTQRRDVIDERGKDIFRLTSDEIESEIKEGYRQLWELRNELTGMDLRKEGYFFTNTNVDFGMYPTLFDYLILSWTDFLLEEASDVNVGELKPNEDLLLVKDFNRPLSFNDPPVLLAAVLMETASRFHQEGRLEAAERWKIKRLLLPEEHPNRFDMVFGLLVYEEKDLLEYGEQAKEILLDWMEEFSTDEAKAEAGLKAAVILRDSDRLGEAVELCEKIEKSYPDTYTKQHARSLRSEIQMPDLFLSARAVMPPAKEALIVHTRNLKEIHFRVYRVNPQTLKDEYIRYCAENQGDSSDCFEGWSDLFGSVRLNEDWRRQWLTSYLVGKQPHKAWCITTGDKDDFSFIIQTINPPELNAGIYLTVACGDESFDIESSLVSVCFLNVSDIVLLGSAGFSTRAEEAYYESMETGETLKTDYEGFHFYTLDAKTGKPVDDVELDVYTKFTRRQQGPKKTTTNLRTDKEGIAELFLPINTSPPSLIHYSVDALARSKNALSYCNAHLFPSPFITPILLSVQTDRPIYRPGHKVQAKVVGVLRTPQGFKTLPEGQTITFSAFDPNDKVFFTEKVELNEFGSTTVDFEIPQGRPLGRYFLKAECRDDRFEGAISARFSVEEYKPPEFEITLNPASEPWKYEAPIEIKGKASYYFGGPVPDASITYRIERQTYVPWFYRHWFEQDDPSSPREVASGQVTTDAEGNFIISFTPTPLSHRYEEDLPDITQFIIEVQGRDAGGRTIKKQETYRAGKNAVYLVVEPEKGFYLENQAIEIHSTRLTINDTAAPGVSNYQVFTLSDIPPQPFFETKFSLGGYLDWVPPALDVQLKDAPNDRLVLQGEVEHDKEGKSTIELPPLSQGAYRIVLTSQDEWREEIKQAKIFVVANDQKDAVPVNAASVTLVEKDEYEVGDIARFVIGSGLGLGIYHIELWAGEYLLRHELIDGLQPVTCVEVPVTQKMKGGFTLRWFGIKGLDVHYGEAMVSVPWKEKKLKISLDPFNKELTPGQEVLWGVEISDPEDRPVEAEVLALMYDRSLEYYKTSDNFWLDTLYAFRNAPIPLTLPTSPEFYVRLSITKGPLRELMDGLRSPEGPCFPALRSEPPSGLSLRIPPPVSSRWDMDEFGFSLSGGIDYKPKAASSEVDRVRHEDLAKRIEPRETFAHTAFFEPHLVTTDKDGRTRFSFLSPEQLTGWRIKLFAFTKDVKEGTLTEEAVTRKDLMVRADLPRFFREKDRGIVTAIVHNESDQSLEGKLFIEITENGETIHQKMKLEDPEKSFSLESHSLDTFNWMIEVPQGVGIYKVRVDAVTDTLSDAEERELPILPSRQRLIDSTVIALSGNESKKMEIPLKDDPTRINESMAVQIEPQLALSILNSIPFLVEYPYECVEQTLNKVVPLSIIHEIYSKYPAIKEAVEEIPDRKSQTPPWQKDDPMRMIKLMETPWVTQCEGRPQSWSIIDLFDPKLVEEQKESTLSRLEAAQLSNGGFPWWPGGEADPYMTLYVLSGLAEAKRYGVRVPENLVDRALKYVNREISLEIEPTERDLALISFAAYVVTSYSPREFSEDRKDLEAVISWILFLDQHIPAMTPLSKAYLAYTHFRLGEESKAYELLDMAMDGAREDPIAGVYWTPEKYSWVWYSDTIEKHAFLLRALQDLRPDDERISGMVRWLLFNRKGTVWKSTKASAAAVYALLDYLNHQGRLADEETFTVKWGDKTYSEAVNADDWLEKPIRWEETGFEITPDMRQAVVEKQGPGIAFAGMNWTYSTDQIPEPLISGMLKLERKFYRRVKQGGAYHLKPIKSGGKVSVGDQIEVQLKINTRSQFEYMHLKDLKAAGFEAEILLSGWRYDGLRFYEEPRDSLTNFFINRLPHGEYILRYRLRPTKPGIYRIPAATLQSMYDPDMTAHSAGSMIEVVE